MKILSVASEIHPLIKTGGLADVAGALPAALASFGTYVKSFLPLYPAVREQFCGNERQLADLGTLHGGPARLFGAEIAGLDLILLDAPHLFDRPGSAYADPTGRAWGDNWRRFAGFSRVAADIALGAVPGFSPDLVHVHDWQAAMTLAYLRYGPQPAPPGVITVHNLAFQGQFGADIFYQLGLPAQAMTIDGVEYFGGVGYLKAGLQAAAAITTVSPTYAREIRTPALGMGLDGLLDVRADDLHGILNGIDTEEWNPATDQHLAAHYSAGRLKQRARNRPAIEERFGLDPDGSPLLCVVSRLTWQKGMDILAAEIDRLVGSGARLAVLGSGDRALEGAMLAGAARHRGRVSAVIGYDEALAHRFQAGADAILIPSRFEPCGLTQLYGLRYGCVPIVARTGGLADTIIDANAAALSAGVATGIQFQPDSGDALVDAVESFCRIFHDPAQVAAMRRQGMKADLSWRRSAEQYQQLFLSLVSSEGP